MKSRTQKALVKFGKQLADNPDLTVQPHKSVKVRNHVALSPLLKKGGIHDKDNPKAYHRKERREAKLTLKKSY